MYDKTQANLAPYAALGTGALGNLRTLAGIPQPASAIPASGPGGGPGTVPLGQKPYVSVPAGQPVSTPSMDSPASPVQAQTSSGYVTMRAPDGSTAQVDQAHVAKAVQLGGKVVG